MTERRIPLRWALIACAWTTFGLAYGLLTKVGPGSTATWSSALIPTLGAAWMWLAFTPVLGGVARRIRALPYAWWVRTLVHLVPCVVMVLATAAVMWGLRALILPRVGSYWVRVFLTVDLSVIQYVAVVVLQHAWDRHIGLVLRERRALMLEQQLVRARLLYLERQLRPHFLFNCLNAIAEMAHIAPVAAASMIASLRRLLASALESAGRKEIPLREELATLDAYLELQRARFMGAIVVERVVSDDVLDVRVPPLMLQPVVENAIQHGLERADEAGVVRIAASARGDRLLIEVEDNGAAYSTPSARGFGIGLRNTRERIETLYGEHGCSLELELRPTGGAVTRILVPLVSPIGDAEDDAGLLATAGDRGTDDAESGRDVKPISITARLPIVWAICAVVPFAWSAQISGLFYTLGRTATYELSGPDVVAGGAWMLLAPCALYLGERFPVRGAHLRRNIALHVVLAAAATLIEGVIVTATGLHGDRPIMASVNAAQRVLGMLAWLALVGWTQADVFARWFQQRGIVTARLRAAIERARWRAATLELQPGLVLRALEVAERQVMISVESAEETLYELSELLRSQLDLSRHTLIPLDAEVRQIGTAQRLRARIGIDGPRVDVTLTEQLSAVRVPNGVLRRVVQGMCDGLSASDHVELRIDGIRYLRQRMAIQLSLLDSGQLLSEDATLAVSRRIELQDIALGHAELEVGAPGEIIVFTDLVALEAAEVDTEHARRRPHDTPLESDAMVSA